MARFMRAIHTVYRVVVTGGWMARTSRAMTKEENLG
jgi:hypothetical protein